MTTPDPKLKKALEKEDLCFTTDAKPGFFREKYGKKFNYYDEDGKRINDKKVITRINKLRIPPAWRNVWISSRISGHLQATGIDEKKRKQYIYHPDWATRNQENKFAKMVDFGLSLPKIRGKVAYELKGKDLDKSKILATVLWLLDKTFLRIGNEEYMKDNNSFGLTTLRNRHAKVRGNEVTFRFRGKSGVENIIEVENPSISKTIKKCIELPGYQLFQFVDDEGNREVIDSEDVNEFLQDLTNEEFTAKDFRTWGASNLAALHLHKKGESEDTGDIKQNILEAVKHAASHLNNTVSVCKTYYVHPAIPESYTRKKLVPHYDKYRGKSKPYLSWHESALIKLLQLHN